MSSLSPGSGSRNAWRRGGLAVLLVFAMVLAFGGVVSGRHDWGGFGWLSRWRDGVRGLVGAGPVGKRPADRVLALGPGLAMDEPAPTGKTWPPQKRVKELPEKRTANGRFYQLSDGRIQAEISAVPVHYRDGKGQWQPIDTQVVDVDRPGFVAGNAKNTFTSLFGDSSDRLVRFEYEGRHVELELPGVAKDVRPRVDGPTVTYAGLADGADLVYEVSPTALKEKIVLRERPAGVVSYEFTLRTGGWLRSSVRTGRSRSCGRPVVSRWW